MEYDTKFKSRNEKIDEFEVHKKYFLYNQKSL
jgi:hypothetical protein